MDIELLKEQLALETTRRQIAETRLAVSQELGALRHAKYERADEVIEERMNKAKAAYDQYSSEHYRNAETERAKYHEQYATKNQELFDENKQLRAALSLKEKELYELRGGC